MRAIDRSITLLAKFNAPITRWGRSLAAVLLALMVALAIAQIVSRATFSYTLDWAEELARMALVWSVLLVAPYAYRVGAHVAIGSFAEALPRAMLVWISVLINLLVIWICAIFLMQSAGLVQRGLTIVSSTMQFQIAWVYSIVPVALAMLVLVGIELVLRLLRAALQGDPDGLLRTGVASVPVDEPQAR